MNTPTNMIMIEISKSLNLSEMEFIVKNSKIKADPKKMMKLKTSTGEWIDKIFIDKTTGEILFFVRVGSTKIEMTGSMIKSLSSMKNAIDIINEDDNISMSLDDILDKISKDGIDSLTESQKKILSSESQKVK